MNDDQLLRYSRHILLPELDIDGQQALLDSHVIIVGLGGLGSVVAMYLAASGIGHLTLVDDDEVELSNLQRQIIHNEQSIGALKVDSAAQQLAQINRTISVDTIANRPDKQQLEVLMKQADVVIDCTDNTASRFLLNEVAFQIKKPLISGAAIRMEGQITLYDPGQAESACYRCLYQQDDDQASQTCSETGVVSPLLGIIGSMQALETIKLLAGVGQSLCNRLLLFDGKSMTWQQIQLKQNPQCPICNKMNNK